MLAGMSIVLRTVALATLLASGTAQSQSPPLEIEQFELANGLQVVLHRVAHVPSVTVRTTYGVGSAHEARGRSGFAHLFEHLMIHGGSRHVAPGQYVELLTRFGGATSGTTFRDRTVFASWGHSDAFELILYLDAERMAFLRDSITPEIFERERAAVTNEREQVFATSDAELYHLLTRDTFGAGHPYSWSAYGTEEHVADATLAELTAFHRTHYVPNNAHLVVVGDVDLADARRLVHEYYGSIPRGAEPPPLAVPEPALSGVVRRVLEEDVAQPSLFVSWVAPPAYQPGSAALDLIGWLLEGRLYRRLVDELGIAQGVRVYHEKYRFAGEFAVEVKARPDQRLAEVDDALRTELERLHTDPCGPDELSELVHRKTTKMIAEIEGTGSRAGTFSEYLFFTGMAGYFEQDLARYASLTPSDLAETARAFLPTTRRVALSAVPRGRPELGLPEPLPAPEEVVTAPDWTRRPAPATSRSFEPPAIDRALLSNGRDVYLVARKVPSVQVRVVSRQGSGEDPAGKFGLADLSAYVMTDGAGGRGGEELAALERELGLRISTSAGRDHVYAKLVAPREHLEGALAVFADVALRPTYPDPVVRAARAEYVAFLEDLGGRADNIAALALNRSAYGPEHPNGSMKSGTAPNVAALRREDLVRFHRSAFRPEHTAVIVVGDLTLPEVLPLLEETLGGPWDQVAPRVPTSRPAPAPTSGVLLIDRPGEPRTMLRVTALVPRRTSADYYALEVLNMLLGASSNSRLQENLRARQGLTYSARSRLEWRPEESLFYATVSVDADATVRALRELVLEFGAIAEEVPAAEIDKAKRHLIGRLPESFLTQDHLAEVVTELYLNDLPLDTHRHFQARIDAVTAADLRRVAETYFELDKLAFVIVGDRAAIGDGLEDLSLDFREMDFAELLALPR